jgi:hypothetical protein
MQAAYGAAKAGLASLARSGGSRVQRRRDPHERRQLWPGRNPGARLRPGDSPTYQPTP